MRKNQSSTIQEIPEDAIIVYATKHKSQEERSIMMNKTDREFTQKFENKLRTSTYLTDEFWTNIVADAKKCKCKCHEESSNTISPRTNNGILHNEQLRYNKILSSCSAIQSEC